MSMTTVLIAIAATVGATPPVTVPSRETPDAPASARHTPPATPAPRLDRSPIWSLRAIECMRLEGSPDPAAASILGELSRDQDVRVRIFATAASVLRGDLRTPDSVLADPDPRVLRAALRAGMAIDATEVLRRASPLLRAPAHSDKLMGIELIALIDEQRSRQRTLEVLGTVVMREDRTVIGSLTPRLNALTGASPGVRPGDWQRWWQSLNRSGWPLRKPTISREQAIASAPAPQYADFALALGTLAEHPIDIAICLDSTRSMWKELPAAQALADATVRLALDLVPGSRASVIAYRDRRSDYIVKSTPMMEDLAAWRPYLWEVIGDRGGSAPEAVAEGLRATYEGNAWDRSRHNLVMLIGDGPPHSGTRGTCADMAAAMKERFGIRTMVVSANDEHATKEVQGFAEIAAAGGGEMVRLGKAGDLGALMLGGGFSDAWAPLLGAFRDRCDLLLR